MWSREGGILIAEVADVDQYEYVAEIVRNGRERAHDVVLRETLDDALLVGDAAVGLRQLVVEEVVVRLERLHLRRALVAPAAIDVEIREDPEQPGAEIRAGVERTPAAEGAGVC